MMMIISTSQVCSRGSGSDVRLCQTKLSTFRGSVPVFLPLQHPVDGLALVGSEHRDQSFVLDVVGHLPALALVQMPDVIVELLDVLPLQVGVTLLLLVLYNFYMENTAEKCTFSTQDIGVLLLLLLFRVILDLSSTLMVRLSWYLRTRIS